MQRTQLLNFSRKLREKSVMVKEVKFCDRLSQNLAETKNGYKLRPRIRIGDVVLRVFLCCELETIWIFSFHIKREEAVAFYYSDSHL